MTEHTATDTPPAAPAVGARLEPGVGRLEPERAALMRQITIAQREVRSWPVWMTIRATMPKWMLEWDD